MGALSAIGEGLLSGVGGALAGAESRIGEEREAARQLTLEEFRATKLRELAEMKNEWDTSAEELKAKAKIAGAKTLLEGEATAAEIEAKADVIETDKLIAGRETVANLRGTTGAKPTFAVAKDAEADALSRATTDYVDAIGKMAGLDATETASKFAIFEGGKGKIVDFVDSFDKIPAHSRKAMKDVWLGMEDRHGVLARQLETDIDSYVIPDFSNLLEDAGAPQADVVVAAPAETGSGTDEIAQAVPGTSQRPPNPQELQQLRKIMEDGGDAEIVAAAWRRRFGEDSAGLTIIRNIGGR